MKDLEAKVLQANRSQAQSESDLATAQSELNSCKAHHSDEVSRLQLEINQLRSKLGAAAEDLKDSQGQTDSWRQKCSSLELELENFKTESRKQADQLRSDYTARTSELDAKEKAAADYKAKWEEACRSAADKRALTDALEAKVS